MRNSSGAPIDTRKFKPIPQGAGGQLIKLSVAKDGARLACADIHGAYVWYGSNEAKPLFTGTSLPSALIPADHTRVGFSGGTYNDSTGCADAVFAPSDSTNIWMIVDGQLCLSIDSGDHFDETGAARSRFYSNGHDQKAWSGHLITVDPDNPSVVLFGTEGNGVYYSTDKGVSFTSLSVAAGSLSPGSNPSVHFTGCDPTSAQVGGIRQKWYYSRYGTGIYESTAGPGGPYTLMGGSMPTNPGSFVVDGNGTKWATQFGTTENIHKCLAGTTTWVAVNTGLGQAFGGVAIDTTKGWVIAKASLGTYYISRDGGTTWTSTDRWTNNNANSPPEQITREKDIKYLDQPAPQQYTVVTNQMQFDPTVPGRLWSAGWINLNYCDPTTGAGSSHPLNWFGIGKGIEEAVVQSAHFTSAGKLWIANWDLGATRVDSFTRNTNPQCAAYKSGDTISNGLRHPTLVQPCASIDSAMDDPSYVAFLQWGGWATDPKAHPHVGRTLDGKNLAPFPTDPSNIPVGNGGGNVAVGAAGNVAIAWNCNRLGETTTDDGETWVPWSIPGMIDGDNGIDVTGNGGFFLNRVDLTHDKLAFFYLFVSGNSQTPNPVGIYRSPDGITWTQRHSGAPSALGGQFGFAHPNHMRAVPGVADHLWITNGNGGTDYTGCLIRSTDGGQNWSASGLTTNGGQAITNVADIGFGMGLGTYAYSIHFWGAVNGVTGAWSSYDGLVTCVLDEAFPSNTTAPMLQVVADRNSTRVVLCSDGNGAFYGDLEDTVNVGL